ncbi:sterol regulatory element-binding protein 1 [Rhypophila decipiens]|uniref:Sterol regulatory element-binding protein 1 n=1 Tax=Rhypophila decipiens TaxID=261697 RepID=A0AAN6YJZ3_9PEZI|nr:sterol regulatory element-binding protein 1 [Rhypophila decipiens]
MAGVEATGVESPSLFAGLDTFDIGDGSIDNNPVGPFSAHLGDDSVSPAGPANTIAPSLTETTTAGPGGPSPTVSPTSLDGSQHSFFNPDPSNWNFHDNTPPYEPTTSDISYDTLSGAPFQQSWELPVHLNVNQQLHSQATTAAGVDPSLYAPNLSMPHGLPNLIRPEIPPHLRNTLTPAQQERLKTIAMPPHLQYHSPKSAGSPDSASSGHFKGGGTAGSSPDLADLSKPGSRKRKSSADIEDDDDDDDLDGHQPVKKTAHNMIEKRYRTNLNDKIAALRDSVPALRIMSKSARGEDTTEDREELHGLTPAHKLNKATVLSKATEYIRHLEKRNNRLLEENSSMQARISAFEKLFMAGAITGQIPNPLQQPPTPIQYPQDVQGFMNPTPIATPRGQDPQGLIPVPDDMKRILTAQQQMNRPYPVPSPQSAFGQPNPAAIRRQQIQQQQQQQAQAGRWNPYFGKLMVGSLAGLMLVEAFVEKEQSNETPEGRGLYALPLQLVSNFVQKTHFSIGGHYISAFEMLNKLKFLMLVGSLVWVFVGSFLGDSGPKPSEKTRQQSSVVEAVPSLASPIHVRRQAWLTAIQTVWVPRHNFFLEAAALLLKCLKYTVRSTFGVRAYLMLAGLSEEQEAARVKAWTIALDAQLAGGDVEISSSRLTLTYLALGTLPDTPLRLMMAALHIRVLLWQAGDKWGYLNAFAAKWARGKWNSARQLNRILKSLNDEHTSPDDVLPDHLELLLEQDCDDVLNDMIIQRAHNLAWNKHTTYNVVDEIDGMNTVVDDPAVRSPMDAVAAWYSSFILHHALVNSLANSVDKVPDTDRSVSEDITLAVALAPIGSNAQIHGLIARATLISEKRGASIAAAIQALGPSSNPDKHPQYSKGVPPLIDSPMAPIAPDMDAQVALKRAMAIAQLQKFAEPSNDAVTMINTTIYGSTLEDMTLLGYTAAFHLMEYLHGHGVARDACAGSLERLAGGLRIWVGSSAGHKAGLDGNRRQQMIDRCLAITKSMVGIEADPGYASMDECDEDGDGC